MNSESLTTGGALLIAAYAAIFAGLAVFGAHRYWLVNRYFRYHKAAPAEPAMPDDAPTVLVQLPIYNELLVSQRLIRAIGELDYPRDRLTIQVLDDSTDATTKDIAPVIDRLRAEGLAIEHLRRPDRAGFKAGALAWGLERSEAELVAIFDADFVPPADFLLRTVGHFAEDPETGMVQARWHHMNWDYSLLTRVQGIMLDGHFVMEHGSRARSDCFFNFNGTAGIWRRRAIDEAGGWTHDTLTEDLDLSYRAQIAGWKFIYRPDVAAPAELPINILAFKTQQHRWTKGSIQTARKMLGAIWRHSTCLSCKAEATLHLLNNLTYVLLVALVVLLLPVYAVRHGAGADWVFWIDIPMLILGTGALASFYANSQRELGRSPWRAIVYLPAIMALGMGMSVSNTWAVLEGLARDPGEFVRTPKYHIETKADRWNLTIYPGRRQRWVPAIEIAFFVYLLATAIYCVANALWWTLPFLALFLAGFGYVSFTTLKHSGVFGVPRASGPRAARKHATGEGG